ncbi:MULTISPECIES: GNAT family N-acetyltransferase [unclassified Streptomyces]|uniref:GNAT family N-acetyltransferase n=1 Tax=unclassified Streptomyces TaxID=2593676 RepID=UPI000F4FFC93|nr:MULTISPECIES: GNAT family N-acetyltransferase [unclassified Streptomyces]MDH6450994.1 GNAT superfamily N-acetyltransferase [Streptomyces sp. SAI-119]MDH6498453.1 GNAT superfamily N-acetyltransferase [Streptomyces sp. SAI-149]QUC62714.1 GNAT family N-acetyltransferase [Streptomyces sp. A2-16]
MEISIRDGGRDDIPVILGMLDSCVEWLVAQGRPGQWGTEPLSGSPRTVESVARYVDEGSVFIAEADGVPAATLTITDSPGAYLAHLPPPGEPERYIHWLASDRRFKGHGVGSALLAHAAEATRRAGVDLLRVDCYAGDDRKLVAYYEANGFTPTETYTAGVNHDWPGQVLARRVRP